MSDDWISHICLDHDEYLVFGETAEGHSVRITVVGDAAKKIDELQTKHDKEMCRLLWGIAHQNVIA